MSRTTLGTLLTFVTLGFVGVAMFPTTNGADPKETGLPDAEFKQVTAYNTKILQEALAADKIDKPTETKARTAALMIATVAQSGGGAKTAERATIRDAALKLANSIKAGKYDDARAQAKALPTLKPDPAAKLNSVKLVGEGAPLEIGDIMNQFSGPRVGGLGLRDKIDEWEEKLTKDDLKEVVEVSTHLQVLFEAAHGHEVDKKAMQPQWEKFAGGARTLAKEVLETARKGNVEDTNKSIKSLNKSCEACHKVFNK